MGEAQWVDKGTTVDRLLETAGTMTVLQAKAFIQPFVGRRMVVSGFIISVHEVGNSVTVVMVRDDLARVGISVEFPGDTPGLMFAHKTDLLFADGVIDYMTDTVLFLKEGVVREIVTREEARSRAGISPSPSKQTLTLVPPATPASTPIERGASDLAQAAPQKRKQDRPTLPPPILQAWFKWYCGQPGSVTKDGAYKSACFFFPNHNVSRRVVEDLVGDVEMGRPKKPIV